MNKKKAVYLGAIISAFIAITSCLFYKKSIQLKSETVATELRKALLAYIEKEELYPKELSEVKFNKRELDIEYESLENGRGCRFIIEGKVFELWDEKR